MVAKSFTAASPNEGDHISLTGTLGTANRLCMEPNATNSTERNRIIGETWSDSIGNASPKDLVEFYRRDPKGFAEEVFKAEQAVNRDLAKAGHSPEYPSMPKEDLTREPLRGTLKTEGRLIDQLGDGIRAGADKVKGLMDKLRDTTPLEGMAACGPAGMLFSEGLRRGGCTSLDRKPSTSPELRYR